MCFWYLTENIKPPTFGHDKQKVCTKVFQQSPIYLEKFVSRITLWLSTKTSLFPMYIDKSVLLHRNFGLRTLTYNWKRFVDEQFIIIIFWTWSPENHHLALRKSLNHKVMITIGSASFQSLLKKWPLPFLMQK